MGSGMLSAFFYCEQVGLNLLLRRCLLFRSRRVLIVRVVDADVIGERWSPKRVRIVTMFISLSILVAAHGGHVAGGIAIGYSQWNKRKIPDG